MVISLEQSAPEKPQNVTETIYRTLLREIVRGQIPPGTRLVHRKIAQQFGASNIPVIDALRQLEGLGLLVSIPGEGTQVRRWNPRDYEETFLIRAALEGVAYRFFAERATGQDIKLLDEHNAAFDAACQSNDLEACVEADRNFHLHIVRASRSKELVRMFENASLILLTIRTTLLPPEMLGVGIAGEHQPLIKALKSRDPDLAEREGRKHLLQSPVLTNLRKQMADIQTLHNVENRANNGFGS